MKRLGLIVAIAGFHLFAQGQLSPGEQESLQTALSEAGNSPVDFARAIENHLKQFPNSPRRAELERALVKTAIDLNDDRLLLRFGESVLARDPNNVQVLEHVATAELHNGDQATLERALLHARHCEDIVQDTFKSEKFAPGGGRDEAKRKEDFDRGVASAKLLQARAQGLLGHNDDAVQLAEASYKVFPSVQAAREAARWLSASGQDREALHYLADAFAIAGLQSANSDAAVNDRVQMADIYRKLTGSEVGLGDIVLKAYDETSGQLAARRAELRQYDPNSQTKDPMAFTVSGLDGEKLKLSSLLGKIVVLDFWATWCGPCRAQHPLYEQVKERFKGSDDVVFLSIDTDEDHSLVKPFLESQKWTQKAYFDDGLQSALKVSSIPTTIIFGKNGEIISRMAGFLPDRFVDMLTERITEALGHPAVPPLEGAISQ
jgi:thiol-disulfide isomerase/thioredoxin